MNFRKKILFLILKICLYFFTIALELSCHKFLKSKENVNLSFCKYFSVYQ